MTFSEKLLGDTREYAWSDSYFDYIESSYKVTLKFVVENHFDFLNYK